MAYENLQLADRQEILAAFAKIAASVAPVPDAIARINASTAAKANNYIAYLEDKVTSCDCADRPAFQIKTKNTPLDAHFQLARLKRMRAEDERIEQELFGEA